MEIIITVLLAYISYLYYKLATGLKQNNTYKMLFDEITKSKVDKDGNIEMSNQVLEVLMSNYFWDLFEKAKATDLVSIKLSASNQLKPVLVVNVHKETGKAPVEILKKYSEIFGRIEQIKVREVLSGIKLRDLKIQEQVSFDDDKEYIFSITER